MANNVRWPAGHAVPDADLHVVNRGSSTATPQQIWAWLARPDRWGEIYPNAWRIRHREGPWPQVALGSSFSWITFGAPVTTTITEYEPFERLAWTGSGLGARGHHAWILSARDDGGCEILTVETQHGAVVRLLRPALAPAMLRFHQRWVDALANIAPTRGPA